MPPLLTEMISGLNVTTIVTSVLATMGTIVGGYATIRIARIKGKPEIQTAVNDGFSKLVSEFQEERAALVGRIDAQDSKIADLNKKMVAQTIRIYQLEACIKAAGLELPPEVVG